MMTPPPPLWRVWLVDGGITVLRVLLNVVDALLVVLLGLYHGTIRRNNGNSTKSKRTTVSSEHEKLLADQENSNNNNSKTLNTTQQQPKRVVIVGASFAGLAVAHELQEQEDDPNSSMHITLIDAKDYFEYVPGVLRCLVAPEHFAQLSTSFLKLYPTKNNSSGHSTGTEFVTGRVSAVQEHSVTVEMTNDNNNAGNTSTSTSATTINIPFDYLVLATGSSYNAFPLLKQYPTQRHERQAQWRRAAQTLQQARTVLILGAGAVGVELAGEIVTQYCDQNGKRVILVDVAPTILTGFDPRSIRYATRWLQRHGVELYLGQPCAELTATAVTLPQNGQRLTTEKDGLLVYKCVGAKPNSNFRSGSTSSGTNILQPALTARGALKVNDHLQVQCGHDHIFAAGDVIDHEASNERKLGHTAEVNAHLVAANIQRMMMLSSSSSSSSEQQQEQETTTTTRPQSASQPPQLLSYPHDVVGNSVTPQIYNISLGQYDATLAMNRLVLNGWLPAIVKWLLEWTKVQAAAGRPVGIYFWKVADAVSNWLGRTILPTPTPTTTTTTVVTTAPSSSGNGSNSQDAIRKKSE